MSGRKRKRDVGSLTKEISEMETFLLRLLSFNGEGNVFHLFSYMEDYMEDGR